MKNNSLARVGGIGAMLVGVAYAAFGITFTLLPHMQRTPISSLEYLYSVARDPLLISIHYAALALGALCALVAVPAISEHVSSTGAGWMRWASNLALLGFAVTAVNNLQLLAVIPNRAATFAVGDEFTRKAIVYSQFTLDPYGWLGFGAVGIWVLVVNGLALRSTTLPTPLAYLGIALGLIYWLGALSGIIGQPIIGELAAGLGGALLAPLWYIWVGRILRT